MSANPGEDHVGRFRIRPAGYAAPAADPPRHAGAYAGMADGRAVRRRVPRRRGGDRRRVAAGRRRNQPVRGPLRLPRRILRGRLPWPRQPVATVARRAGDRRGARRVSGQLHPRRSCPAAGACRIRAVAAAGRARAARRGAEPPAGQVAIGFTSGSTGQPKANPKTWASFHASNARNVEALAGLDGSDRGAIVHVVATVPPQHMYGIELSIVLPLLGPCAIHRRPAAVSRRSGRGARRRAGTAPAGDDAWSTCARCCAIRAAAGAGGHHLGHRALSVDLAAEAEARYRAPYWNCSDPPKPA